MIPSEYITASRDFEAYLDHLRDITAIESRNVAYTMTQGVFQVFRRRLDVAEALRFADALPPVLRAIFVADWDPAAPQLPFTDRAEMGKEVQALPRAHNFSPDTAIEDVAGALRRTIELAPFERVLGGLPPEAACFWRGA
jgi:uncharacterized protein (DUF2267 family)